MGSAGLKMELIIKSSHPRGANCHRAEGEYLPLCCAYLLPLVIFLFTQNVRGHEGIRMEPLYQNDSLIYLKPDERFALPRQPVRFAQIAVDFEICKAKRELTLIGKTPKYDVPAFKVFVGEKAIEIRPGVCRIFDVSVKYSERKLLAEIPIQEIDLTLPGELKIDLIGDYLSLDLNGSGFVLKRINGVFNPSEITFSVYGECVRIRQITVNQLFVDSLAVFEESNFVLAKAFYKREEFNQKLHRLQKRQIIASRNDHALSKTLMQTVASDSVIHDALLKVEAMPGAQSFMATDAKGKKSIAKDSCSQGSKIDIRAYGLDDVYNAKDILIDKKGTGVEFRMGANRVFKPKWESGCVACLQSCPDEGTDVRTGSAVDECDYQVSSEVKWKEGEEIYIEFFPIR
jgi:hypothetical protein